MFSLCGERTFQVFVAFIILPLSYCPVRFLDLTPLIFSHQSVTSNPPISLIISFELSPSFWGTQVPKTQCSSLGVVSPQSQATKRGGRVGESWMHLKLVLICISKIVLLFHPLPVCLPLFLLFSFHIMNSKIGFYQPHVSHQTDHSHLTKLVASWTSSKVVLLWSLYTMCIALAYAGSESSDELYFPPVFPSAYRAWKDTCGGLITNGLANIKTLLNTVVRSRRFLSCISKRPSTTLVSDWSKPQGFQRR